MTLPEITTRDQEVVTIAGRIELYREELDYIINRGAYIIAYRRIYRPCRMASGAYRAETVYTSGSPLTRKGRYYVYSPAEYADYRQWLEGRDKA